MASIIHLISNFSNLFYAFRYCSKHAKNNWYPRHLYVLQSFFIIKQGPCICLSFGFLLFALSERQNQGPYFLLITTRSGRLTEIIIIIIVNIIIITFCFLRRCYCRLLKIFFHFSDIERSVPFSYFCFSSSLPIQRYHHHFYGIYYRFSPRCSLSFFLAVLLPLNPFSSLLIPSFQELR